jgi:hypothetical protein
MTDVLDTAITDRAVYRGPSAQGWFADGERVGYDPKACAIIPAQDAPLKIFLKREGKVPFEHRQIDLAEQRLGRLGLQIARLPGGHLITNEQPEALAALIAKFERGLARMQPAPRN